MLRSASITGSLIALGLAFVPAAAAAPTPPGSVYGPESANRALAHRQARRLLRAMRLPADARRATRAPTGTRGRLSRMPYGPAPAQLVDDHSFWRSDEPPGLVLRYVAHHLPPGVVFSTRVAGGSADGAGFLRWQLHGLPGVAMRAVAVSAVALAPGLTAVRLDGEAQWMLPRPRWEWVPARGARAAVAGHGTRPGDVQAPGPESRSVGLGAHTAARLAAWVDRQPAAQPGVFSSCGLGDDTALVVRFLAADGRLLARVTESSASGCGALTLTVGGRTGPALQDGGLQTELVRLHVLAPCRAGELSVGSPVRTRASGAPALHFMLRDSARVICTAAAVRSITLLGAGGRVLVGHDLSAPAGPPAVLYPESAESVLAEFQNCPSRPRARSAHVRLASRLAWTVPLALRRPVRPCPQPLTLVTGPRARADLVRDPAKPDGTDALPSDPRLTRDPRRYRLGD